MSFFLSQSTISHQKSIYGFLDLIGDMGGLLDILTLFFAIFLRPYNTAIFNFTSIDKLYIQK